MDIDITVLKELPKVKTAKQTKTNCFPLVPQRNTIKPCVFRWFLCKTQ